MKYLFKASPKLTVPDEDGRDFHDITASELYMDTHDFHIEFTRRIGSVGDFFRVHSYKQSVEANIEIWDLLDVTGNKASTAMWSSIYSIILTTMLTLIFNDRSTIPTIALTVLGFLLLAMVLIGLVNMSGARKIAYRKSKAKLVISLIDNWLREHSLTSDGSFEVAAGVNT